jgi:pimeloyl-ACP methyl ester carboxylesterase
MSSAPRDAQGREKGVEMAHTTPQTGYAAVNGLQLYYEIHGTGAPLVVLHGAFMTIELLGDLVPGLARTRQVIAVELQGHGHTADIERPLTYEQLADDIAALLRYLRIGAADLYGYSLGGGVALQVALRHPQLVRKLVLVSSSYTSDGMYPEVRAGIEQITPDLFRGHPLACGARPHRAPPRGVPHAGRQDDRAGPDAVCLAGRGHRGAHHAHLDHHRGLRWDPPGARGGAVPAAAVACSAMWPVCPPPNWPSSPAPRTWGCLTAPRGC